MALPEAASVPKQDDAIVTIPGSVDAAAKPGKQAAVAAPQREATMKDFIRVFSYAKRLDWILVVAALVSSIGSGVTMPLMNVIFGRLVGSFSEFSANITANTQFQHQLNTQSLYLFILFLARFAFSYVNKFSCRMISVRLSAALRLHYLQCVFGQTIHVLDSMPSGAAANTITTTANTLQLGMSENLGLMIESIACIVASIVVAFTYSWLLTLVISSVVFFIVLMVTFIIVFIMRNESRLVRAETRANAVAAESFASIRMLMACGAESKMAKRHAVWVHKARHYGLVTAPWMAALFGVVYFSLYGIFALAFWYGIKAYGQGRIHNVGTVVVVLMSVITTILSVEHVASPMIAATRAMVAAAEFFTVIDAPRPSLGHLTAPEVSPNEDIVFADVDFAYPGRPHVKVLDGLNLRIEMGKVNAIVGPSGSGKSTIIGLVERWYSLRDEQYVIAQTVQKDEEAEKIRKWEEEEQAKIERRKKREEMDKTGGRLDWGRLGRNRDKGKSVEGRSVPGEESTEKSKSDTPKPTPLLSGTDDNRPPVRLRGSVTTGGHNLEDIQVHWWRSQIGLVQQEPFLFNDTIFNNVAFGLVGSIYEDADPDTKRRLIQEACREAFADEFIDRLPDGYETRVGDQGAKLSGGQRQRLAIARSIVKRPAILILDEATSAIDVRSERIVQAALDRVSRSRTTITVAHRLSTIKNADKIFVLQHGRCVEEGTHETLLTREAGVYRRLVEAQQLMLGDEGQEEDEEDEMPEPGLKKSLSLTPADGAEETGSGARQEEQSDARRSSSSVGTPRHTKNSGLIYGFGRLLYEQRRLFPLYALVVAASMGGASASPLHSFLFARLIVIFSGLLSLARNSAAFASEVGTGNFYALMFFVLALGAGAAYLLLGFGSVVLEQFVSTTYRQQYFESFLRQHAAFFDDEDHASGVLSSRLGGDPRQLRELMGVNLGMALVAVFTVVGALAISFAYGWKLALLALGVTMPLVLLSGFYRTRYEQEFYAMNSAVFAESSRWAAESIGASRTVTALTLEAIICSRYENLLAAHVRDALLQARFRMVLFALSNSVTLACQALIFWYGGHLVETGEYSMAAFFVCYMASIQGSDSAGQGLGFIPNAAQASAAAHRILTIRESGGPDALSASQDLPGLVSNEATSGGMRIELRHIAFRYPTRDIAIFRDLNITVEPGQFAAIVGASGAGKSSVVALLERFYEPQAGQVLVDGRDVATLNVHAYRRLLSLVAQEPALFQGTVRENVLLGVAEAETDPTDPTLEARMVQACQNASIHDFVMSLPQGYNTDLGSRGVALSGGQKQRLAIARALLRQPHILILDEATSSLDSDTERLIQATLARVARGRTTVAVAHRLSTIQHADVIYVLGDGCVLERGTHAELLRARGVYYSMCQSQSLDR